jgi:two-component system response regulator (stage 0 sporulation protein F)
MARPEWMATEPMNEDSPRSMPEPPLKERMRVLLAEDHPLMRHMLCATLLREGYEVIEVEDGPALIRALILGLLADRARAPDLIISDVRMPGLTGLEVLARLRREDWKTPVILMTAFGDQELHAQAARLGAARVLDKPFELEELRAAVRGLLKPH